MHLFFFLSIIIIVYLAKEHDQVNLIFNLADGLFSSNQYDLAQRNNINVLKVGEPQNMQR
jgi:hypothetical protein